MTDLAKLANAIFSAMISDDETCWHDKQHGTATYGIDGYFNFVNVARAVLEALREPSEEMIDIGHEYTGDPCWREDVKKCWQAMIDSILQEKGNG